MAYFGKPGGIQQPTADPWEEEEIALQRLAPEYREKATPQLRIIVQADWQIQRMMRHKIAETTTPEFLDSLNLMEDREEVIRKVLNCLKSAELTYERLWKNLITKDERQILLTFALQRRDYLTEAELIEHSNQIPKDPHTIRVHIASLVKKQVLYAENGPSLTIDVGPDGENSIASPQYKINSYNLFLYLIYRNREKIRHAQHRTAHRLEKTSPIIQTLTAQQS